MNIHIGYVGNIRSNVSTFMYLPIVSVMVIFSVKAILQIYTCLLIGTLLCLNMLIEYQNN